MALLGLPVVVVLLQPSGGVPGLRVSPALQRGGDGLGGVRWGEWSALLGRVSLLVVNLAFGVMSRSAPQLNVFSLGFPFSLVFGLVVVWLLLSGWGPQFERLAQELFAMTRSWVE